MALNAGETPVKDAYWGADRVKRVYLGDAMVHRATETKLIVNREREEQYQGTGTTHVELDFSFYTQITVRLTIIPAETFDADCTMKVGVYLRKDESTAFEKFSDVVSVPNDKKPCSVSVTATAAEMNLTDDDLQDLSPVHYWYEFDALNPPYTGSHLAHTCIIELIQEA